MHYIQRYSVEVIVALLCLLVLSIGFLVRCHAAVPVADESAASIASTVGSLEHAIAFPPLKFSNVKSPYSIDTIIQGGSSHPVAGNKPMSVMLSADRPFIVVGWAIDSVAHAAAAGVYVTLDGTHEIPALYGNARPDVSTVLGFDVTRCGFAALVDAAKLTPGSHVVGIDIVDAKQDTIYRESSTVTIVADAPRR